VSQSWLWRNLGVYSSAVLVAGCVSSSSGDATGITTLTDVQDPSDVPDGVDTAIDPAVTLGCARGCADPVGCFVEATMLHEWNHPSCHAEAVSWRACAVGNEACGAMLPACAVEKLSLDDCLRAQETDDVRFALLSDFICTYGVSTEDGSTAHVVLVTVDAAEIHIVCGWPGRSSMCTCGLTEKDATESVEPAWHYLSHEEPYYCHFIDGIRQVYANCLPLLAGRPRTND